MAWKKVIVHNKSRYGPSGLSGAGYRVHQHEVEHRESLSVSGNSLISIEQSVSTGCKVRVVAAVGEELATKPRASTNHKSEKKTRETIRAERLEGVESSTVDRHSLG